MCGGIRFGISSSRQSIDKVLIPLSGIEIRNKLFFDFINWIKSVINKDLWVYLIALYLELTTYGTIVNTML